MLDLRQLDSVSRDKDPKFSLEPRTINGQTLTVRIYKETKARPKTVQRSKPTRNVKKG